MNDSYQNSTSTDEDYIQIIPALVYFPLQLFTYPLYSTVYWRNYNRDRHNPIFQVIIYSYRVIQGLYYLYYFYALGFVLMFASNGFLWFLLVTSIVFVDWLMGIFDRVNNILLCLIAIQRFMIYFFPSTEKHLSLNDDEIKHMIWVSGAFFVALSFGKHFLLREYYWFEYIVYNIFIFTCACLYIPVYISIRKMRHLPAAKLNYPQKFAIWQLIAIPIVKSLYIPFVLLNGNLTIAYKVVRCVTIDQHATPLIIQLAYLGCNRRNLRMAVMTLRSKTWAKILCYWCWRRAKVLPGERSRTVTDISSLQKY